MKKIYFFKALVLLLLSSAYYTATKAQNFQVIDIDKIKNSNPRNDEYSTKNAFPFLNGYFYFTADDGIHGVELWRTNGTAGGTKLVRDLNPGPESSNLNYNHDITVSGGKLYFSAGDKTHGDELWVSDGTSAGTLLLADIAPGSQSSNPQYLTDVNGKLFFFISYFDSLTFTNYNQLWKTDGTPNNTVLVSDFSNGYNLAQMVSANGKAFFTFNSFFTGLELYASDGTGAGTYIVSDINPFGNSYPSHLTPLNGLLYFAADDGYGGKLYVTDGNPSGTYPVNNFNGVNLPVDANPLRDPFAIRNDVLYFQGKTFTEGNELFKYDPADPFPNVTLVKDILPGVNGSFPGSITSTGDKLFFTTGAPGADAELWTTDGTDGGTFLVKDINPGGTNLYYGLTNVEGNLMFAYSNDALGYELWKSDGTDAGTQLVKDIAPGVYSSYPQYITYFKGTFLFGANDLVRGYELWRSDGTTAGTTIVKNINQSTTASSNPYGFTANSDSKMVFTASDEKNGNGLWITDGSIAGTKLLKGNIYPFMFAKLQNQTYFISQDIGGFNLWKTDGTKAGTKLVPTPDLVNEQTGYIQSLIATNNLVYITVFNYSTQQLTLWRTDGTNAGTYIVKRDFGSFYQVNFTPAGNFLYFTNYDNAFGYEVWKTDGTQAGTGLLKDINPGLNSSNPANLYNLNGKLYFSAYDGGSLPGNSLWTSDGTTAGTKLVKALIVQSIPFGQANGKLFLYGEDAISKGYELFISDGTAGGTRLIKDLSPGPLSSNINILISGDTVLYFIADDGTHGQELWKSNGTTSGTKLVKDISPGLASTAFSGAVSGKNKLFFLIGDVLWQSDGTKAGTNPIEDPDLAGVTNKNSLASINGTIYFSGYNYATGQELYAGSIDAATALPLTKLAPEGNLNTDEFAVKLLTNPVGDQLQFTVNVKKQQLAEIKILDASGRMMLSDKKILSPGSNRFSYSTTEWSQGIYPVNIQTSENFTHVLKAVK